MPGRAILDLGRPVRAQGRAAADHRQDLRRSRRDPEDARRQGDVRGRRRRAGRHEACRVHGPHPHGGRRASRWSSAKPTSRPSDAARADDRALHAIHGRLASGRGGFVFGGERGRTLRIRSQRDFWCGLLFVAIGVAVMVLARTYRLGTAARMGPGYFPTLLGGLLALLGLTLAVPALVQGRRAIPAAASAAAADDPAQHRGVRPGAGIARLRGRGRRVLVAVGGFADPGSAAGRDRGACRFLVVFSIGIFVMLLGLPLPLWPSL